MTRLVDGVTATDGERVWTGAGSRTSPPREPPDGVAGALVETTKAGELLLQFWMASSRSATFCRSSVHAGIGLLAPEPLTVFSTRAAVRTAPAGRRVGSGFTPRSAKRGGCTDCSGRRRSCSPSVSRNRSAMAM